MIDRVQRPLLSERFSFAPIFRKQKIISKKQKRQDKKMSPLSRRDFIATTAAFGVGLLTNGTAFAQRGFDVEEATIAEMQLAMQKGTVSARELVQAYLQRIRVGDRRTNSMIEINPDALTIATELDRARRA